MNLGADPQIEIEFRSRRDGHVLTERGLHDLAERLRDLRRAAQLIEFGEPIKFLMPARSKELPF